MIRILKRALLIVVLATSFTAIVYAREETFDEKVDRAVAIVEARQAADRKAEEEAQAWPWIIGIGLVVGVLILNSEKKG